MNTSTGVRRLIALGGTCFFTAFILLGCGGEPRRSGGTESRPRPQWVTSPGARSADGKHAQAVGMASKDPNVAMQTALANSRGRQELAKAVSTEVRGMVKDFMQRHRDYADPSSASSIEFVQTVSRSVSSATLEMAAPVDQWTDPSTGTMYALVQIPTEKLRESVRREVERAAEANKRRAFGAKTEDVLEAFAGEIEEKYAPPPPPPKPAPQPAAEPEETASKPEPEEKAETAPPPSGGQKPRWIDTRKHPSYPANRYWLAVGMGRSTGAASTEARAEMARQVASEVKSYIRDVMASVRKDNERSGFEEFLSRAEIYAQQSLVATRIAETWSDGSTVYALAVMDLEAAAPVYAEQIAKHREDARRLFSGGGSVQGATESISRGNLVAGFASLKKADEEVRQATTKALALKLIYRSLGRSKDVGKNPVSLLDVSGLRGRAVSGLEMRVDPDTDNQVARPGEALAKPLRAELVLRWEGRRVPVANLPLLFAFQGGRGDIQPRVVTDGSGRAECKVSKVVPTGKVQNTITVRMDSEALALSGVIDDRLLPQKSFTYVFPVPRIAVFVEEVHFGQKKGHGGVQSELLEAITEAGFKVLDETEVVSRARRAGLNAKSSEARVIKALGSGADYIVCGRVEVEMSGEQKTGVGTIFMTRAVASVRILDVQVGKVISAVTEKAAGGKTNDREGAARNAVNELKPVLNKAVRNALKKHLVGS